jgi:hypothetical protein
VSGEAIGLGLIRCLLIRWRYLPSPVVVLPLFAPPPESLPELLFELLPVPPFEPLALLSEVLPEPTEANAAPPSPFPFPLPLLAEMDSEPPLECAEPGCPEAAPALLLGP